MQQNHFCRMLKLISDSQTKYLPFSFMRTQGRTACENPDDKCLEGVASPRKVLVAEDQSHLGLNILHTYRAISWGLCLDNPSRLNFRQFKASPKRGNEAIPTGIGLAYVNFAFRQSDCRDRTIREPMVPCTEGFGWNSIDSRLGRCSAHCDDRLALLHREDNLVWCQLVLWVNVCEPNSPDELQRRPRLASSSGEGRLVTGLLRSGPYSVVVMEPWPPSSHQMRRRIR